MPLTIPSSHALKSPIHPSLFTLPGAGVDVSKGDTDEDEEDGVERLAQESDWTREQ